ncbi:hypothetical protein [Gloeobacter morelensis]|uniref:hypothetical protein n=1 Tax=Gloeobacter morelensis TaxID=2907343 RepID=UPI001E287150|nr:hypothetical protein [Gloeobacter morelensis]UFP97118.1 hypothetical protein ISF26_23645 [Gloeobacter morelensis MG652769]
MMINMQRSILWAFNDLIEGLIIRTMILPKVKMVAKEWWDECSVSELEIRRSTHRVGVNSWVCFIGEREIYIDEYYGTTMSTRGVEAAVERLMFLRKYYKERRFQDCP